MDIIHERATAYFPETSVAKLGPKFRPESRRTQIRRATEKAVEEGMSNSDILELLYELFAQVPRPTIKAYFYAMTPRRKAKPKVFRVSGETIIG